MKKRLSLRKCIFLVIITLSLAGNSIVVFADDGLPFVEPGECPIDMPADIDVDCGYLIAPENYAKPEGKFVRLPYIILHGGSANAGQTPLLFTEGGPGGTSLQSVWGFKDSVLLQDRDIIIFEQRGNLNADPALACNLDELYDDQEMNSPCLEKFRAAGIDLSQYTTAVLAEDIESLRLALGIDQWNLFGASYSTRLAQVLMDRYSGGIRSVILQSVSPLTETRYQHDPEHSYRALHVMFEDCAADPGCAAAYPELEERFFTLVKELNQTPIELVLESPADGSPVPYEVSGYSLINWMVGRAFYGPTHPPFTTAYYPLLIDKLAAGETEFLDRWAENELKNEIFEPNFIAFGLYFTVNCQDDANSVTRKQIEGLSAAFPMMDGFYRHWEEWQLCQMMDFVPAPPLAENPISSELPTLVLAGSYDPITPPRWARLVAENLSNAIYVEFPSKGHSLDSGSTCAEEIKRGFLQDPWGQPDTTCVANEPPPTFVLPSQVIPMEGFEQSLDDIDFGNPDRGILFLEVISYGSLIIYLLAIVFMIILVVIVLAAKTNRNQRIRDLNFYPHLLASLIGGLGIASVILLSMINQNFIEMEKTLELFGLQSFSSLVLTLGIVVVLHVLGGIGLIISCILTWMKSRGALFSRVILTLTTLATIAFWPFYVRWDLVKILIFSLTN